MSPCVPGNAYPIIIDINSYYAPTKIFPRSRVADSKADREHSGEENEV